MFSLDVSIVFQQFFQTGAGDIREFDLRFFGGAGGHAAFDDVLLARARGLHHLIDDAVVFVEVAFAEGACRLVDHARAAVGLQIFVSAVLGNEMLAHELEIKGLKRRKKRTKTTPKTSTEEAFPFYVIGCRLGRFFLAHRDIHQSAGDDDDFFDGFAFAPFQDCFVGDGEGFDLFFRRS